LALWITRILRLGYPSYHGPRTIFLLVCRREQSAPSGGRLWLRYWWPPQRGYVWLYRQFSVVGGVL